MRRSTTNPRVYAASDVTGAPQYVYAAAATGRAAAVNALAGDTRAGRDGAPTRPGGAIRTAADPGELSYCVVEGVQALGRQPWGDRPAPWAPGRREETTHVDRAVAYQDKTWCIAEVDIFCDLSAA